MRRLLILAAMVVATPAAAESPSVPPEIPISVTLPAAQWNIVLQGLGELPLKTSIDVLQAIQRQAAPQTKPPEKETKK